MQTKLCEETKTFKLKEVSESIFLHVRLIIYPRQRMKETRNYERSNNTSARLSA